MGYQSHHIHPLILVHILDKFHTRIPFILGTWSVSTLLDSKTSDRQDKNALMAKELTGYDTDIAALSETHVKLGFTRLKHQDWFDENDPGITTLIEDKRQAKKQVDDDPKSKEKVQHFKDAKAKYQDRIRLIQNQWWVAKHKDFQTFADQRNKRMFYQCL